jgi:hypothetical protein
MHPAGVPEFSHPGIDNRKTGLASLPSLQLQALVILAPGKPIESLIEWLIRSLWKMIEQMNAKLPPTDLTLKAERPLMQRQLPL